MGEENIFQKIKIYWKEFMFISGGRAGINIRFSKFGAAIFALFIAVIIAIAINVVVTEISQRNIEIEKHRKTIQNLKEEVIQKDKELEELKEFKSLLEAIKNLSKRILNEEEQVELGKVIYMESKKYKYDWRMVMAVIMTESNFRAKLSSNDPSYGLMQIKYMTGKYVGNKIGVELDNKYELYNITKNVLVGAFYLFEQIIHFKDVKKGIVAYNLGPTKTRQIDKMKEGRAIETDYLRKVLSNYNYLKNRY